MVTVPCFFERREVSQLFVMKSISIFSTGLILWTLDKNQIMRYFADRIRTKYGRRRAMMLSFQRLIEAVAAGVGGQLLGIILQGLMGICKFRCRVQCCGLKMQPL